MYSKTKWATAERQEFADLLAVLDGEQWNAPSLCGDWRVHDALRANSEPRGVSSGLGGRIALTECMIHQQDVRRPLRIPRTIATDVDWTAVRELRRRLGA